MGEVAERRWWLTFSCGLRMVPTYLYDYRFSRPEFSKANTYYCVYDYFTYSTYQKRLSEKNCVLLHIIIYPPDPLPPTIVQWCIN